MKKSAAPSSKTTRRANCSLMTHLTPAAFTTVRSTMTKAAIARSASGEWPSCVDERSPAIDSPKPVAHNAFPMAWTNKRNIAFLAYAQLSPKGISVESISLHKLHGSIKCRLKVVGQTFFVSFSYGLKLLWIDCMTLADVFSPALLRKLCQPLLLSWIPARVTPGSRHRLTARDIARRSRWRQRRRPR